MNIATNVLVNLEVENETVGFVFFLINNAPSIWLPVSNALISICTNRPYREALTKVFGKNSQQITAVSPVELPFS